MASLERKLKKGDYSLLTEAERGLLDRAFQALYPSRRKTREQTLKDSYNLERYRAQREEWRLDPEGFLNIKPIQETDVVAKLYRVVDQLEQSKASNQLVKRTVCLAMARSHTKGTNLDSSVLRIPDFDKPHEKEQINQKLQKRIQIGRKWDEIIELCAKIAKTSNTSCSGVIWLLDNGSVWERANENECKESIESFGKDFWTNCKEYSDTVNRVVQNMRSSTIVFHYYIPTPKRNGSQDVAPKKRQRRTDQPRRHTDTESPALVADNNPSSDELDRVGTRERTSRQMSLVLVDELAAHRSQNTAINSSAAGLTEAHGNNGVLTGTDGISTLDLSNIENHNPVSETESPGSRAAKRLLLGHNEPGASESPHDEHRYEDPESSVAGTVEDISSGCPSSQASTTSVVRSQVSGERQTQNNHLMPQEFPQPLPISEGWSTSTFGACHDHETLQADHYAIEDTVEAIGACIVPTNGENTTARDHGLRLNDVLDWDNWINPEASLSSGPEL